MLDVGMERSTSVVGFPSETGSPRVLHVTEGFDDALGGTAAVVKSVAAALAASGMDVSVAGLARRASPPNDFAAPRLSVRACAPTVHRRLGFSVDFGQWLEASAPFQLVHVHGLWRLHYLQAASYAIRRGVPLVVSTHGMLESSALAFRKWPKRVARALYQDRILRAAGCLHTTGSIEAGTVSGLALGRPIAVVPWGVEVPAVRSGRTMPRALSDAGVDDSRIVLTLSRFHPIKGLDVLLTAWRSLQQQFREWVLVLAGYDERGHRAELMSLAASVGIADRTIFLGPVHGDEKERLFAAADLFVLPSRSENFGLAVAEALARRIPVITTDGTPWKDIETAGCGWCVAQGAGPLADGLRSALATPRELLAEMGARGRAYVQTEFSVETMARRTADLYSWLLGRGSCPNSVVLERTSW